MGDAMAEALANTRSLLVTAKRLGVPVLAGTDALPFGSVPLAIDALVRHGLQPATALRPRPQLPERSSANPVSTTGRPRTCSCTDTTPARIRRSSGRPRS